MELSAKYFCTFCTLFCSGCSAESRRASEAVRGVCPSFYLPSWKQPFMWCEYSAEEVSVHVFRLFSKLMFCDQLSAALTNPWDYSTIFDSIRYLKVFINLYSLKIGTSKEQEQPKLVLHKGNAVTPKAAASKPGNILTRHTETPHFGVSISPCFFSS